MALRNQPYIPLYVQDYLTDEKLNMCSWSTQGIYIKIMCFLHKQRSYGSILFKQNSKQTSSTINYFAQILIRNIPCQLEDMENSLSELLDNEVLYIDELGLHQKRMVKDGQISNARSKAAKKGGGNPNLLKQKSNNQFKQNLKQITEYENEYENEDKSIIIKGGMGENEVYSFEEFWNDYDKKVGSKSKLEKKWNNISDKQRMKIKEYIPYYKISQQDKKYRKNPETFLNNESWNDELINNGQSKQKINRPTSSELQAAVEIGIGLAEAYKG